MSEISVEAKYAQPEVVDFWLGLSRQGLQTCEQEIVRRYLPPQGNLLDIGCGAGRAVLALSQMGYCVSGIDLSLPMLAAGRRLSAEARLTGANVLALPFADESFDAILMFFGALQHVPGRRNRRQAMAGMARLLKPEGQLILGLDNLAPALVCYGYWLKEKLLKTNGLSRGKGANSRTGTDTTLWARQGHPFIWRLRGLMRTFRWRTWSALVDLGRSLSPLPTQAEPGDTKVAQVSLPPTPHFTYYHLYRVSEVIDDAANAGLSLLGWHSGRELTEGVAYPPFVRQQDKQLFFAFQKPAYK